METKTVIEKIKESLDESLPESFIVNHYRISDNYQLPRTKVHSL